MINRNWRKILFAAILAALWGSLPGISSAAAGDLDDPGAGVVIQRAHVGSPGAEDGDRLWRSRAYHRYRYPRRDRYLHRYERSPRWRDERPGMQTEQRSRIHIEGNSRIRIDEGRPLARPDSEWR